MNTEESVVQRAGATSVPDRRAARRAPLEGPALIDASSSWQSGRCHNVSIGGMAVEADTLLPAGTTLDVYFELPSGVAVETRAEVVRAEGDVLGLKFIDLDKESHIAVRAHCRVSGMHQAAAFA